MQPKTDEITVGLFGTCAGSKWRDKFITKYNKEEIAFFNPQVDDWSPEMATIEAEHLVNDEIILFPVTSESYGTGSLAETGFSIMSAIRADETRFVVIMIDRVLDIHLMENEDLAKESSRSRALVIAHLKKIKHPNVFIVDTLDDMLTLSVNLVQVANTLKDLKVAFPQ